MRPTRAEINLTVLRENVRTLKKIHKGREFFCPMVKANAYGHGDVEVTQSLLKEGVDRVGVILTEEAIRIREKLKGEKQPQILVFGYLDQPSLKECMDNDLTPVIGNFDSLSYLPKDKKIKIHLKFNTGMARLGFQAEDSKKVLDIVSANKNIEIEGICTHFANGDDAMDPDGMTRAQMRIFAGIEKAFEGKFKYSHCLNSGALVSDFQGIEDYHKNKNFLGARPGIAMYGYPPKISDLSGDIRPVMSVHTSIVQVRSISKGQTVSYGGTWKAQRDSLVATLCVGYGDGYPRHFSNNSSMIFRGERVPVIGRVCMDYTLIDLTEFRNKPEVKMGEQVTLWGYQGNHKLSAEELAQNINTISYELITRLGPRIPRIYV